MLTLRWHTDSPRGDPWSPSAPARYMGRTWNGQRELLDRQAAGSQCSECGFSAGGWFSHHLFPPSSTGLPGSHPTKTQPGNNSAFYKCQDSNPKNLNNCDINPKPSLHGNLNTQNYTSQVHAREWSEINTLIIHEMMYHTQICPLTCLPLTPRTLAWTLHHFCWTKITLWGLGIGCFNDTYFPIPTHKRGNCWRETVPFSLSSPTCLFLPRGREGTQLTRRWGEGSYTTLHQRSSKEKLPLALDPPALSWDQDG